MNKKTIVTLLLSLIFLGARNQSAKGQAGQAELLPNIISQSDSSVPPPDYVPVEKEPRIVKQTVPAYPEAAFKDGIEGKVFLKLWVDKDGIPHQVVIMKRILEAGGETLQIQGTGAHGYVTNHGAKVNATIFDKPTMDAAMEYRFTPAIMNGKPVAVWVVIPFTFKLKSDSTQPGKSTPDGKRSADGEKPAMENASLNLSSDASASAEKLRFEANRLSEMITRYNTGMYYESLKEYRKAIENYETFVREAELSQANAEEMIKHAEAIIKKYERLENRGK